MSVTTSSGRRPQAPEPRSGPGPGRATAVSLPSADLRRLAGAVTPHAAEAREPALRAVQWQIRGGALWLAATGAHTAGTARWPLPGGSGEDAGPVLVSVEETAALARFAGDGPAEVTVDVNDGTVTVARRDGEEARSAPLPAAGLQDWRDVLSGLFDGTPGHLGGRITFDSAYLSKFRLQSARPAAGTGGPPALLQFRLRRHLRTRELMFLVTCEDWFIGVIRPVITDPADAAAADALIQAWPRWLAAGT